MSENGAMFDVCLLGIIQGITEFFPISSTAHLIILPKIFGFHSHGREIDIFLNLGTLFAVITFFYKNVLNLIYGALDTITFKQTKNRYEFVTLFFASIPVILFGAIIELVFDADIQSVKIMAINLIIFGAILYACDMCHVHKKDVSRYDAIWIGLSQTLSLIPGVSRLGACLSTARLLGYSEWQAFKYSMILSLAPVSGACVLKLAKVAYGNIVIEDYKLVIIGCVCSYIFGILTLLIMKYILRFCSFKLFAAYRILFGAFILYYFAN